MRGIESESLARVESAIRFEVSEIARRREVSADVALVRAGRTGGHGPAPRRSRRWTRRARWGSPAAETWSGAGHDAQHLTTLAPALLLFVPLHGGESHTPQEGADMDEIVEAARVVVSVLGAQLTEA